MKFHKMIIIFLFLLLVSGCAQQEPAGETFVASDDALTFQFLEGQPPDRIFGDNEFDAAVLVSNEGGWDIAAGLVEMILNDGNFGLVAETAEKANTQALEGIKRAPSGELIQGGKEVVTWSDLSYGSIRPITEEIGTPLGLDACYNYATIASTKLCVVADARPPCSDDEEKSVENSGAPIKISEFTELKSTKNIDGTISVGFKFRLAKTGEESYRIYAPTASCSGVAAEHSNNVRIVLLNFPGLTSANCNVVSNNNLIALESENLESDEVFCKVIVQASGSYEDNLQMQFSYLIKQSISKNMQVIPI